MIIPTNRYLFMYVQGYINATYLVLHGSVKIWICKYGEDASVRVGKQDLKISPKHLL